MNDFMSHYNSQVANLRQSYNAEMQKLQNEAKQYTESLRQQMQNPFQQPAITPVQPKQEAAVAPADAQSAQSNVVPINVQILAVLGDIKGKLDKAFPDKEEVAITETVTDNAPVSEPPVTAPAEVATPATTSKEEVKPVKK